MKLSTGSAAQSRYHLPTVEATAEWTPFWEPWTRCSVTFDSLCSALEKTFTYLLTYYQDIADVLLQT